jgi:hypothetical protein
MANEVNEIHVVSNYNNSIIGAFTDINVARKVALVCGPKIETVRINHICPGYLEDIRMFYGEEAKKKIEELTVTDLSAVKLLVSN